LQCKKSEEIQSKKILWALWAASAIFSDFFKKSFIHTGSRIHPCSEISCSLIAEMKIVKV
jgi:hypothetical protein